MSTASDPPVPAPAVAPRRAYPDARVTQLRVIHAEWTKLRSLRSTRWSLLTACVAMAGLGPLIAAIAMARWNHMSLADRLTFNPIDQSLGGYELAQFAIGVLGVLVISGEYSTGMIRSSLMAVPKRLPVLWAKIVVFAAVSFVLMLAAALIGYLASQAILTEQHVNVPLSRAPALRTLFGTVLFMTVTGVLCVALGTIVRSTAGGIAAYVGILFVLPGVVLILPGSISDSIHPYLPSSAGEAIAHAFPGANTFSPWGGFALFCGYTVAAIAAAAVLLLRRDA
jgi:ABC-type transport system involved in multi-copper enzyme maturation permease subunit